MANVAAKTVQTVVSPGSATYSDAVLVDVSRCGGISIGIGCVYTGSLTYSVQHTFDETPDNAAGTWYDHADYGTPKAATAEASYAYGVTAVRVLNDTWSSGSVTMTVVQAGGSCR